MYAEAAVDGSHATIWAPTDATASLTSDLGRITRVTALRVDWTDTKPSSSRLETSLDGSTWSPAPPAHADGTLRDSVQARYVRVTLTRAPDVDRTGVRELEVIEG
jgi:hypothetical protein